MTTPGMEALKELLEPDTVMTDGLQALEELNKSLGVDPVKPIEPERAFDPAVDGFSMTTQMVKRVCFVFEVLKQNYPCNLTFGPTGIDLFAMNEIKTVCMTTHLDRRLFSEFKCDRDVVSCVNLAELSKRLVILQKFNPHTLSFSSDDSNVSLRGCDEDGNVYDASVFALSSAVEEFDSSTLSYAVKIRFSSVEFARRIETMPASFSVALCGNRLIFKGEEDQGSVRIPLPIDAESLNHIRQHEDVRTYKATFAKKNLNFILKGAKLAPYVTVGFANNKPLYTQYVIDDADDMSADSASTIDMYFSSKFDD